MVVDVFLERYNGGRGVFGDIGGRGVHGVVLAEVCVCTDVHVWAGR